MADWDVVSTMPMPQANFTPPPGTPDTFSNPSGPFLNPGQPNQPGTMPTPALRLEIAPNQPAIGGGPTLPPEADALYSRVRQAEGTAEGSGYVYYGGQSFTPSKDFPDWQGVMGPQGKTHAAGPGQWQPDTWNGLKPDFHARFGRDPDFSSDVDQKAMTWLNAGKVYPGGEAKMRADLAAGKLDTAALTNQWRGFGRGGGGGWSVVGVGNHAVLPAAIAAAQSMPDTDVVWMSPGEYKQMVQPGDEAEDRARSKSLDKSLAAGDQVQSVPSLTVKNGRIVDQDGWRRAQALEDAGVTQMPVAVHGASDKTKWLTDMGGRVHRFDFQPVPKADVAKPQGILDKTERAVSDIGRLAKEAAIETAQSFAAPVMGAARLVTGPMQLATAGARALGVPGASGANEAANRAATALEGFISDLPPEVRPLATAGDIGASMMLPLSRIAELPALLRPLASAAAGAGIGAGQPIPNATPQNYGPQMGQNALVGGLVGGGLQAGAEALNALRGFVTPGTLTRAAVGRLEPGAKRATPEVLKSLKDRLGAEMNRIESSYDVRLDMQLVRDLVTTSDKARTLLGDAEARPIENAIDNILSRAKGPGIIPGKSAATLWHKGSKLDTMTESKNPEIASLAQDAQNAVRRALNRQLPPAEAAAYSRARHDYRDFKIIEKSLRPGETELTPGRFITQTMRRFPEHATTPTANALPALQLARAAGETWRPGASNYYGGGVTGALGALIGHALMPGIGGVAGGTVGAVSGHLLLDSLLRMRYASPNALRTLRPPTTPVQNVLSALPGAASQMAAPAAVGVTMPRMQPAMVP